jgi:alpha-glucosidase (family GH31 glycosyl hydrolase)
MLTLGIYRSWFKDVLKTQVWNANISGYMQDFGEYTPVTSDTKFYHMVSDAFYAHDLYPFLWAQYGREIIEEFGLQDEALVFHRSAATGANKYMYVHLDSLLSGRMLTLQ